MKIFTFLLAGVAAGLSVLAVPAHAQFSEDVMRCRGSLAKDGTRYAGSLVAVLNKCHRFRAFSKLPAGTNCNDLGEASGALGGSIPSSVFASDPGADDCAGLTPADAYYTSCPGPCESIAIEDWPSVDICLQCVLADHVERFGTNAFGEAVVPLDLVDATCARSIYTSGTRIIPKILKAAVRCEKRAIRPNQCLVGGMALDGWKRLSGSRRAYSIRSAAACGDANLSAVGSCATSTSDLGCVLVEAERAGEHLAYDILRMIAGATPPTVESYVEVSAGQKYSCAIRTNGTVACWGNDWLGRATAPPGRFSSIDTFRYGSCGLRLDGSLECWGYLYADAVASAGDRTFQQISLGYTHMCGVQTDGTIACFGDDSNGQASAPPGVFAEVRAGLRFSCARRDDGTLTCWGDDGGTKIDAPSGTFVRLDSAENSSCAIRTDNTVACWGSGYPDITVPGDTFTDVSVGLGYACGERTDGTVACWGSSALGQQTPPAGAFLQVSAGEGHACGIRPDGSRECWGGGKFGEQLAPQVDLAALSVARRAPLASDYFLASVSHVCMITVDGSLSCWGENADGQATPPPGEFSDVDATEFTSCAVKSDGSLECWGREFEQEPSSGTFSDVSHGRVHGCAVRDDSALTCWGSNGFGQATPPPGSFEQVSLGLFHSCAIRTDGTLVCWGSDENRRCSAAPNGEFLQISAGAAHTCAIREDGTVSCWGDAALDRTEAPDGTFSKVSAGYGHSCGVRTDGTVDCWGDNALGQATAPADLFSDVSAGGAWSCGIRRDGSEICWGSVNRE